MADMIGIIILSHGRLAEVLVETAQMIMGPQEHLHGIPFTAKDSLESLRTRARESLSSYQEQGCLILTDIIGGSATNICVDFLAQPTIRVVTGVSLPMVLDALGHRAKLPIAELARHVCDSGSRAIIDVKEFMEKRSGKKSL